MRGQRPPRVRQADLRHIAADIEAVAGAGSWTLTFATGASVWSAGLYALFELDPATTAPSIETFNGLIHPDDRERALTEFATCIAERVPYDVVHRVVTAAGRTRTVSSRAHASYADDGAPLQAVGVLVDITRQQLVRRKLDDATAQLMAVWEHVPEGFILATADGTIVDCNPVAERALGVPRDALVGQSELSLFVDGQARAAAAPHLQRGHAEPWVFESELADGAGRSLPVEVATSGPFRFADRTLALVSFRDIGARKHAEAAREAALEGAFTALSTTLEKRDPATAGHERRVADLAGAIAAELELDDERRRLLRLAALVHDVGKISVPAEILAAARPLTELELRLVKEHPATGYEIVRAIPFLGDVAEFVYQHHELLDGSGYPRGQRAASIPLDVRILTVADIYEAMTAERSYRPAHTSEEALATLRRMAGPQLDPQVVGALARILERGAFSTSV